MSKWVKLTVGGVGDDRPVYVNLDQVVAMERTGATTCLRHYRHRYTTDILVKETPEQILGKAGVPDVAGPIYHPPSFCDSVDCNG